MYQRIRGVALTLILGCPTSAWADVVWARPANYIDCYCRPVQLIDCFSGAAPRRATPLPDRSWAQPSSAPPSKGPLPGEPPLAVPGPARRPAVSESHSYYDSYAVAQQSGARSTAECCTVGFWNLSDRDVQAKINGQARTLPRGKNVPIEVPREFVWQLEGREAQVERIAAGESALTIVIRR